MRILRVFFIDSVQVGILKKSWELHAFRGVQSILNMNIIDRSYQGGLNQTCAVFLNTIRDRQKRAGLIEVQNASV